MIKAKEIDGELWIKASDHHQAIKEALAQTQEPVAHWSDCAVHSEPAYPKGECDCGGIVAVADYTALSDKYVALSDKYVALKAQPEQDGECKYCTDGCLACDARKLPPQRTWVGLTDDDRLRLWLKTEAEDVDRYAFARAIEAKIKELNT